LARRGENLMSACAKRRNPDERFLEESTRHPFGWRADCPTGLVELEQDRGRQPYTRLPATSANGATGGVAPGYYSATHIWASATISGTVLPKPRRRDDNREPGRPSSSLKV